MCVLCAYGLSPYDWTTASPSGRCQAWEASTPRTARRAVLVRGRICDAVLEAYGVRVRTPTGSEYVVSDTKGRSRIARTLGEIWSQAGELAGRPLDPLDAELLARFER